MYVLDIRFVLVLWMLTSVSLSSSKALGGSQPEGETIDLMDCIRFTLSRDPNIVLQRQSVRRQEGALLEAQGSYDWQLSAGGGGGLERRPSGETGVNETASLYYSAGVSRRFRTGLSVDSSLRLDQADDKAPGAQAGNVGSVRLDMTVPLLQGRGREVTTAGERAAVLDLDSVRLDQRQTVAARVLTTVLNYWD